MISLFLAALLSDASAAVTFERAPHKDEAGALDPAPISNVRSEVKAWRQKAQRRGVYAAVDAAVRWRAAPIDACVRAAGTAAPVVAKVDIALLEDGQSSVTVGKGGDPTLAGCVAAAIGGQQLPVPLYAGVKLTYTAKWEPSELVVAPPSAEDAKRDAFAPLVDAELGFGPIPWGGRPADHEGLYATTTKLATTFYTRQADQLARWMGARTGQVLYAFGEDGLYGVRLAASGTTTTWKLREALVKRYGPSKWDTRFGAYFWRGESVVVQLQPVPDTEIASVTILDIARARKSGLADRLPGDRDDPTSVESNRRMPKIFRD
ncbi:MAG: hypothetical protein Q8P18_07070 [Pseudomonadota bacterium]|nr:hypothetical protein [Pseudomonadota bacterium]